MEEAVEQFRQNNTITRGFSQHKALYAYALARARRREEALKLIREIEALSSKVDVASVNLALAWTALGDHDRAFRWLERGYRDHLYLLRIITVIGGYEPLRADPRFEDLIRRMGL